MPLSDADRAKLLAKATKSRRSQADGTSREEHSLSDIVAFLKYNDSQAAAAATKKRSIRLNFIKPPGTVGDMG